MTDAAYQQLINDELVGIDTDQELGIIGQLECNASMTAFYSEAEGETEKSKRYRAIQMLYQTLMILLKQWG